MAGFSFAPQQLGGFGGGYLSLGIGQSLGNAVSGGLRLANGFREFQNSNMLDQYQIPASEAQYDAARLQGANQALTGQAANSKLLQFARTGYDAGAAPVGVDPTAYYASQPGGVGQNGMSSVGANMVLGNPYPKTQYGGDAFQAALMGDNSQRTALNYQPGASLGPEYNMQTNYLRY